MLNFKKELEDNFKKDNLELITEYKGINYPISIRCKDCGRIYEYTMAKTLRDRMKRTDYLCECKKTKITESVQKFINYYEKNCLDTLLYTNSLFHDNLSDRNDYNIAFNIIIMYYKEILNYKLNNKLTNFIEYKDYMEQVIGIVKLDDAIKKIDIALDLKKTIGNNVNINLLVDKLIIDFAKVDQNEKC